MTIDLKHLIRDMKIDPDKVQLFLDGAVLVLEDLAPFEGGKLTPMEFLVQAENDYDTGGQAALLNSITNSRRAIQCQIDQWIRAFRFDASKNNKKKIEIISELGYAPRILRKVADARNLLEHDYKLPRIQEVEEALDLAWLFISVSREAPIPCRMYIVNEDSRINVKKGSYNASIYQSGLVFELYDNKKPSRVVAFIIDEGSGFKEKKVAEAIIKNSDLVYLPLLKLMLAVEVNFDNRIDKAFSAFWNTIHSVK